MQAQRHTENKTQATAPTDRADRPSRPPVDRADRPRRPSFPPTVRRPRRPTAPTVRRPHRPSEPADRRADRPSGPSADRPSLRIKLNRKLGWWMGTRGKGEAEPIFDGDQICRLISHLSDSDRCEINRRICTPPFPHQTGEKFWLIFRTALQWRPVVVPGLKTPEAPRSHRR